MENFNKHDLQFTYHWSGQHPATVTLDRETEIDRHNGDQMLMYFNQFLRLHGLFSRSSINHLEELVYNHMPAQLTTPAEINTWVGQNWNHIFISEGHTTFLFSKKNLPLPRQGPAIKFKNYDNSKSQVAFCPGATNPAPPDKNVR